MKAKKHSSSHNGEFGAMVDSAATAPRVKKPTVVMKVACHIKQKVACHIKQKNVACHIKQKQKVACHIKQKQKQKQKVARHIEHKVARHTEHKVARHTEHKVARHTEHKVARHTEHKSISEHTYYAVYSDDLCPPHLQPGLTINKAPHKHCVPKLSSKYFKSLYLSGSCYKHVVCENYPTPDTNSSFNFLATPFDDHFLVNTPNNRATTTWVAGHLSVIPQASHHPIPGSSFEVCHHIPGYLPGIHLSKRLDKLGMRSSDTAVIFFEDVRVPVKNIIGEEGMGFTYQMMQFQEERLALAVSVFKPLELILQQTIDYTRQRIAFGQPLLNNQYIHFKLAELATEIEALRALVYRAVELYVAGQDVTQLASMCKLKGGRLARQVTDACLQFWGGMGFTNEANMTKKMIRIKIDMKKW
ncbi:unnamed protein product, partial [Meganyctiphanes norvegica]